VDKNSRYPHSRFRVIRNLDQLLHHHPGTWSTIASRHGVSPCHHRCFDLGRDRLYQDTGFSQGAIGAINCAQRSQETASKDRHAWTFWTTPTLDQFEPRYRNKPLSRRAMTHCLSASLAALDLPMKCFLNRPIQLIHGRFFGHQRGGTGSEHFVASKLVCLN
jgi:hypothetical protein